MVSQFVIELSNETLKSIQNKIYTIHGLQVMLDNDLAEIYQVETKVLNQAVKRNIERFPDKFRFQLTKREFENLKSQFVTSSDNFSNSQNMALEKSSEHGGRRKLPFVFTEQGVSMLSAVLRSETAIKVSIQIIDAFVKIRKFISQNAHLFQRINNIEQKQIVSDIKQLEIDNKIDAILDAIEERDIKPKQSIFYDGQIFDAYTFVTDLIRTARQSIILVDNYIDDTVLTLLTKRKQTVTASIYTPKISKQLALDLQKHNAQYSPIKIKGFNNAHDRFMIIDEKTIYHFGASLKDLGEKWFAFSKLDMQAIDMLSRLKGDDDEGKSPVDL
ncbi:MAG: ORF6N domain-containing protein [Candidatus Marinimicrobia bacterium]|nr:ORF6N domain-containing protein [Candidatus Neomarinimicrobiota bacterium]